MMIEFDTCIRHVWLKRKVTRLEKTCICVNDRYKFSPRSSHTTHLLIGFIDSSTAMYSRGKISKGGELETAVQVNCFK